MVTVCIANYNGEYLLVDCIDSVLAQANATDVEIIVHDDASTDRSLELLRIRYPQVQVLASADNVGFCIANNRMAEAARGNYILLLNNDAALAPDAIGTLLHAAEAINQPTILTLPQHDWETGELVDRGCLLDPFYNPVPNLDPGRRQVAYVIGACLWIPRALWKELGGFPAWMESIAEDIYLCSIARLGGASVEVLPASGFRHRLGTSFGGAKVDAGRLSTTLRRRRLSERNKTYTLFVCTPGPLAWPLLAVHLAALLVEGCILSLVRRKPDILLKIYVHVLVAVCGRFKHLLAVRREVQLRRTTGLQAYFRPFTWLPRKLAMLFRFGVPAISG